jgi:extracellular elastinolytic metalloproteinase
VQPYGSLNEVDAGDAVPLRFTADGYRQLDVLASNSSFSRKVDLRDATGTEPEPGVRDAARAADRDAAAGRVEADGELAGAFHYNWKTLEEWAGTCRELVLTRDDGSQHRAFFRFL